MSQQLQEFGDVQETLQISKQTRNVSHSHFLLLLSHKYTLMAGWTGAQLATEDKWGTITKKTTQAGEITEHQRQTKLFFHSMGEKRF